MRELIRARHALLWAARARSAAVALVLASAPAGAGEPPPPPPAEPAQARPTGSSATAAPGLQTGAPGPEMGTRLFFAPTARSLPSGTGAIGLTEVAFPWLEAALGDRVSVLGLVLPPLEEVTSAGVVVAPKVQIVRRRRVRAAAGFLQALTSAERHGVAYGVVTVGGARTGATLGCGYGYGSWSGGTGSRAVFFVGLDHALARSARVVVEDWIGGDALGLPRRTLVGSLRIGGRWSFDLGAVVPVYETGAGTPFPVFTIARRF